MMYEDFDDDRLPRGYFFRVFEISTTPNDETAFVELWRRRWFRTRYVGACLSRVYRSDLSDYSAPESARHRLVDEYIDD